MLAILSMSRFSEPYSRQLPFVQLLYDYISKLDNIALLLVYKLPLTGGILHRSICVASYHFKKKCLTALKAGPVLPPLQSLLYSFSFAADEDLRG